MAISVEGFGADWIVTRKPGGEPRLSSFRSPEELQALMRRLLEESEKPERPTRRLQQASPPPPPPPRPKPKPVPKPQDLNCRTCGACCAPADQSARHHVRLDPEDLASLKERHVKTLTVQEKGVTYLKTKRNTQGKTVCAAYKGTVAGNGACLIYDHRPLVCRAFEVGERECLDARKIVGLS